MRKSRLLFFSLFCLQLANAQQKPSVFLNHLYFVMDSTSFAHLFDSAYLQVLGDTEEVSTTTTKASWTGKYFSGKESYFEFFSSNKFKDAPAGGFGLGFMTFKTGDIHIIKDAWAAAKTDSVENDTVTYDYKGKIKTWFYSAALYTPDSLLPVSTWLMENTPEELNAAGFSDEEIKQTISWSAYTERRHHKKFDKAFSQIVGVEIQLTQNDYIYLKKSLLGFGLKEKGNRFFNGQVSIIYRIDNTKPSTLQSVTFNLDRKLPPRKFMLGSHVGLKVNGNTGVLNFTQ